MRSSARRMSLVAFSALAATTLFTAPAGATVFEQGISVRDAYVAHDGAVTLSGTYHCEQASPMGAMQIKATVAQEGGGRLSVGAEQIVCDGQERRWVANAPGAYANVRPGRAVVTAELQEVRFSGLMPRSVTTVAQDSRDVEVHRH
ncbi:DUF6299 family protein [Streptomyces virginiae]|uniref:DUF6299 family protein n=1 Tax=Streptomyces TaxID=1883 RepID=UPI00131E4EFA|nr:MULTISPECIES: DUF6299 family protein [Streptomyces]MCX5271892.1 DUF6299 family protein [Streptomyces virginiae]MYV74362.1 hypothetical protein [Streptomyces sp. SID1046]